MLFHKVPPPPPPASPLREPKCVGGPAGNTTLRKNFQPYSFFPAASDKIRSFDVLGPDQVAAKCSLASEKRQRLKRPFQARFTLFLKCGLVIEFSRLFL